MEEHDESKEQVSDCDSLEDILEEYKTVYNSLSPEDKMEADVQRALKMINYAMSTDPLPEELHARFVGWFLQTRDCEYVEEAFPRYLDKYRAPLDQASDNAKEKLRDFWDIMNEREREDAMSLKKTFA